MHVSLQSLKTHVFISWNPVLEGEWEVRRGVIVLCVVYWWAGELGLWLQAWDSFLSPFSVVSVRTEPDLWGNRPSVTWANVFLSPQRSKAALWYSNKCMWAFVRKSTLVAHLSRCGAALPSLRSVETSTPETKMRPQHGGGRVTFSFLDWRLNIMEAGQIQMNFLLWFIANIRCCVRLGVFCVKGQGSVWIEITWGGGLHHQPWPWKCLWNRKSNGRGCNVVVVFSFCIPCRACELHRLLYRLWTAVQSLWACSSSLASHPWPVPREVRCKALVVFVGVCSVINSPLLFSAVLHTHVWMNLHCVAQCSCLSYWLPPGFIWPNVMDLLTSS